MYSYNLILCSNKKNLLIHARTWMVLRNILPVKEVLHEKICVLYDGFTYKLVEQIKLFCGEKSKQWLPLEGRRGQGLTGKGHYPTFWGFRNVLYLDRCMLLSDSVNVHLDCAFHCM